MDTETISTFGFRLYWLFKVVSASQDEGDYVIPSQNNLKLPYLYFGWVIFHWYACDVDGRSGGRAGGRTATWLPKFLACTGYYQSFSPMVFHCVCFTRARAPLIFYYFYCLIDEIFMNMMYQIYSQQYFFSFWMESLVLLCELLNWSLFMLTS